MAQAAPAAAVKSNRIDVECRDQQIHKVTVYNDRAEVVRQIKSDIQAGMNEIHIKNVSHCLVADSLRVDGLGDVLLHEVQVQDKLSDRKETPKVTESRARVEAQKKEIAKLTGRQDACQKRSSALDKLIAETGSKLSLESTVDDIQKVYEFYDSQSEAVREKLYEVEAELKKAEEELKVLEFDLAKISRKEAHQSVTKTFVIFLESKHDGKVQLYLTYQVYNASWYPSYDIRVDTYSSGPMMRLTYFGQISQSTGEDWLEVPVILSTSQPSLGGNIPELATLSVQFAEKQKLMELAAAAENHVHLVSVRSSTSTMESVKEKKLVQAGAREVKEQILSTEFTISRPGMVPSGGDLHKVTIGMVNMIPQLSYEVVPRKSSSVFLAATVMNDSPFPLLRGEASVFLNNSFVNKLELKSVSPGEKFTCSLGVDPGIKVIYKPAKIYHEKSGMIKSWSTVLTEQEITVRNTRKSAILLTVKEQIPRSVEDKIRVRLLQPVNYVALDKEPTHVAWMDANDQQGIRLTKANNLEWTVQMHDGQVMDLVIKYSIEHPTDQTILIGETH